MLNKGGGIFQYALKEKLENHLEAQKCEINKQDVFILVESQKIS